MAENASHLGDGERSPHTIKSLCQELIPGAIDLATENGRYAHISKRDTYYKVRNKYLTHSLRPYHREYLLNRKPGESDESRQARRGAERPFVCHRPFVCRHGCPRQAWGCLF